MTERPAFPLDSNFHFVFMTQSRIGKVSGDDVSSAMTLATQVRGFLSTNASTPFE